MRLITPCWTVVLAVDNVLLSRMDEYVQTVEDVGGSRETVNNVNVCRLHALRDSRVMDLLKSSKSILRDKRDETIQYSRPRLVDTGDVGETVESLTDLERSNMWKSRVGVQQGDCKFWRQLCCTNDHVPVQERRHQQVQSFANEAEILLVFVGGYLKHGQFVVYGHCLLQHTYMLGDCESQLR
jgi:hypothetical protein